MAQPTIINAGNTGQRSGVEGGDDGSLQLKVGPAGAQVVGLEITSAGLVKAPAKNKIAFSAYQSVAQSITSSSWAKVNLQSEEFDTAAAFDSTTNYRFQPQVAGYYQFSGAVSPATTVTQLASAIYKNGVAFKYCFNTSATTVASAPVGTLIYLNGTTDYVELFVYCVGTSPALAPTPSATYFQGFLAVPD